MPASMYDPHSVGHRPLQPLAHPSPHMNHSHPMYHHQSNHVPTGNHVMAPVPDVHKRDKDAIYGYVDKISKHANCIYTQQNLLRYQIFKSKKQEGNV